MCPPSSGSSGSRLSSPTKMFTEMMISRTSEALACQPILAATTWPVISPTPTTLVTCPPGVLARFLANRCENALGRVPITCTVLVTAWLNIEPA